MLRALRFLREPSKPNAPRPVAKSGTPDLAGVTIFRKPKQAKSAAIPPVYFSDCCDHLVVGRLRFDNWETRRRLSGPGASTALDIALGGLPAQTPVKVDADIEVSAKTVGELRKLPAWPENLAITTPQDGYPDRAVRISKVDVAARTSPKSLLYKN